MIAEKRKKVNTRRTLDGCRESRLGTGEGTDDSGVDFSVTNEYVTKRIVTAIML